MRTRPCVSLAEVLNHRKEFIHIDDFTMYKRCRVQLHARGVILRDKVSGIEIKTKAQQVCRTDDFLVAEIDAKVGGFGVVPPELDAAIVSSHYFLFDVNQSRLDPRYLSYFSKTAEFQDQVTAQGSTNYAAVRPAQILAYKIPLPPIEEQRRIVHRIDEIVSKLDTIHRLRSESAAHAASLAHSMDLCSLAEQVSNRNTAKLQDITERITKGESPEWQGFSYQETGPLFIRSENVLWGRIDTTKKMHIPPEFHSKLSRSQLRAGDILINLVGASIGRACVVPDGLGDANVNQAVAVIRPLPNVIDSNFLVQFLLSRSTQEIIHGGKVDTARPNISLGDLRDLVVPTPSLTRQRELATMMIDHRVRVEMLLKSQRQVGIETESLIPTVLNRAFSETL